MQLSLHQQKLEELNKENEYLNDQLKNQQLKHQQNQDLIRSVEKEKDNVLQRLNESVTEYEHIIQDVKNIKEEKHKF